MVSPLRPVRRPYQLVEVTATSYDVRVGDRVIATIYRVEDMIDGESWRGTRVNDVGRSYGVPSVATSLRGCADLLYLRATGVRCQV